MAAGLGFKDFTTGEVLTAADVDGYLMQGVWVFASAAARDAAVTSPQEGNFAYLKDTNVTTYYTGSAWANLDTTGMTNPMTTTGDTIYSSSGSTPARLGIGSTGDVLTVAGGVPSWAAPAGGGGLTLLSTTNLSGTSTSITSISGSYTNLLLQIIDGVKSGTGGITMQFNSDTGSNYADGYLQIENTTAYPTTNNTATALVIGGCGTSSAQLSKQSANIWITNYTSTGTKNGYFTCNVKYHTGAINFWTGSHVYVGSSAISSIQINASGGGYTGGEIKIWGMK